MRAPRSPRTTDEIAVDIAIGRRVMAIRQRLDLTQSEIARRMNLDPASYYRLEQGQRGLSVARLLDLCDALGVEPMDLLSGDLVAEPEPEGVAS